MNDIRRIPTEDIDDVLEEEWVRDTDEYEILGVGVVKWRSDDSPWHVTLGVAEFIRTEPLESLMRSRIDAALRAVPGVSDVGEEDHEVWWVNGSPSADALVHAAVDVVDSLAEQTRAAYNQGA